MKKDLTIWEAEHLLDLHFPIGGHRVVRLGYEGFTYSRVTEDASFNGICMHRKVEDIHGKAEDIYIFYEITIAKREVRK